MPAATKIAGAIKNIRPEARIVLGGSHVTLVNAAYRKEQKQNFSGRATRAFKELTVDFDVLVAGDGEEAIFMALGANPPKLIDADDPNSNLFLNNHKLAIMPYPARHLIDVPSYNYWIDGERALSLIAQLGCPFECGFCGGRNSPSLRRVRMRPIESIVSEMTMLYEMYGIKGFMLYDDELNVNSQMVDLMEAICKAQDKLGVRWRLRGFIASRLFTARQAMAMYEAGFRWVLVGFESGSSKILQNMNKKATLDDNNRCLNLARQHNLKVKALMSIGHPGESIETITQTQDWLIRVRPDDFDVTVITAYPGSPYYDEALLDSESDVWVYTCKSTGDRLYEIEINYTVTADYYKGIPGGGYKSFVFTDYLSPEELVEWRDNIEFTVRQKLNIPFNPSAKPVRFERSMGQGENKLPSHILKVIQK